MTSTLDALAEFSRQHPTEHKLLLSGDVNYGRELLLSLARRTGGWMGWEPKTLGAIARELAFTALGRARLRGASDLEIAALADAGLMDVLGAGGARHRFAELTGSVGFRGAVRDTLLELRVAGITPARLAEAAPALSPARDIAAVLEAYQSRLADSGLIDAGGILAIALEEFEREAPFVLPAHIVVAPGLTPRGLSAFLLERLERRGVTSVSPPSVVGPAPFDPSVAEVDAFRATSAANELREVVRRLCAEHRRWDEVELVATDPDGYAVELDALAAQLALPVTVLPGIPFERSRLGRALARWLDWLETGLPSERISAALDAGDLAVPDPLVPLVLRTLGIGWGRERYDAALNRLTKHDYPKRPRGTEHEAPLPPEVWANACAGTAQFLRALLAATPKVPEPGSATAPISTGQLAAHAHGFLDLLQPGTEAHDHALSRLRLRLDDLAEGRRETVPFPVALAEFRSALADFRVWSDLGPAGKPWLSSGGRIHLTDLAHAGTSGRVRTFILGLDSDRTAGPRLQDPFLPDELRARLGGALATTAQRREERRALLARTFAGLTGRVTLSYPVESDGGREASPAPIMLAACRQIFAQPALPYEKLRELLGPPASPVPDAGTPAIDDRDAWFTALTAGALLLNGSAAVRAAFPGLSAGLEAAAAWRAPDLLPHHGTVPDASRFDPRMRAGLPISASSLETLARCPRAWFYRYVLRIVPPSEPVFDRDRWLDPAERGSLLHTVFERFGREYADRRDTLQDAETLAALLAHGQRVIAEWRAAVPPPSEAVFEREQEDIRHVLRGFLMMERQLPPGRRWAVFELGFGGAEQTVNLSLPGGARLALFGRVDRVDRLPGNGLVVVDYKTGSARAFEPDPGSGPFGGGRHLQAGLYAHAVGALLGTPVERFEYRFPTEKGEHRVVSFDAAELARMPELVDDLLNEVSGGHFLPTTDSNDCRFCDFQDICRVRQMDYGRLVSPRADWAAEHGELLPGYGPMRHRRGEDT